MVGALKALGLTLEEDWPASKVTVHGCAGAFPAAGGELHLGNAGTAMRPLTAAVAAAGRGEFVLDGVARMRERPIQDLVDGLVQLGAPLDIPIPSSATCLSTSWTALGALARRGPDQPLRSFAPPFHLRAAWVVLRGLNSKAVSTSAHPGGVHAANTSRLPQQMISCAAWKRRARSAVCCDTLRAAVLSCQTRSTHDA
jgi:EPSP synthase (3-phosphoshikimate 1-carboxyvinyltransferase)